jgi:hypothetical protein
MGETLREQLDRRNAELKQERSSFIPHWQELSDFLAPRTGKYLTIDTNKGAKKNQKIINSAASTALRTLKSGMHAGMTSQARPWFRLTTGDTDLMKSAAVKQWLFDVETRMRIIFTRSNFYNVMPAIYGSCGGHGTAAMAILEDPDTVIRCYPFPIGTFKLALNDKLKVDTLYREFPMTVRQMVMQFGYESCSTSVKNLWDRGTYSAPVEIVQAIEPNLDRDHTKLNAKDKPFRSVYFEVGSNDKQKLLKESGFDEFPVMAPRWDIEGDDVYGWCPGMDALGAVKGLQFMERRKAEAIDKMVRPPMLGDSSLRTQRTSILPGDITYIDGLANQQHAGFRPAYQVNPNTAELRADITEIKQEISHIFYEDLMLMFATSDRGDITAEEVRERHQEKLLVLGPTIERFGEELYDPAIDRTFAIMLRTGQVPRPPRELEGQQLKVEYTSIMAQAQKLIGVAGVDRFFGFVGNLAAMFGPQVLDKVNSDEAVDAYGDMHGVQPKLIRSEEQVKGVREERAKAQQTQQMMEAIPAMAQGAQAAKTLSETDVGNNSVLSRMMGGV